MIQCGFTHLHLCLKKTDMFCWTLWGKKKFFKFVHISMDRFIAYYIKTYSLQEDLSNNIKHVRPCFNLFWQKKCSETIWRGWLNLTIKTHFGFAILVKRWAVLSILYSHTKMSDSFRPFGLPLQYVGRSMTKQEPTMTSSGTTSVMGLRKTSLVKNFLLGSWKDSCGRK